jgi:hypothetical protein
MKLPKPPAEVPADNSLDGLAPKFRVKLSAVLARLGVQGHQPRVAETLRSDERVKFLYGFGREYDDGRGIVTKATDATKTWHHYGLAADVVHSRWGWNADEKFWIALRDAAVAEGLTAGYNWKFVDKPHIQWGKPMRDGPSDEAVTLLKAGGVEAVWRAVGAV